MKCIRSFAAYIAAVTIAACGQPAATTPEEDTATATSEAGKPESTAPAASNALTSAQLVGRWGDNSDCTKDVVFNADGTFTSFTGGSGTWSLNGGIVTMTAANGVFPLRVSLLNENTLLIGNPDGSIGTSQRC